MDYPRDFYPSGQNPLPPLKRWCGKEDQQCFHLEPPSPTVEGGAGKERAREENIRAPHGFGELSKVFACPTASYPGAYQHLRVFCTTLMGSNRRLNVYRGSESEFELAKYNPLRHPQPGDWNNPNLTGRYNVPVEGLEKAVLDMVNYPRIEGCVMEGPLSLQPQWLLKQEMAEQPAALKAFFGTPELFQLLIEDLWDRWEDLGNLFRTSQYSARCIYKVITHVGYQKSRFQGLELKDKEAKEKLNYSPLVLISPGRSYYSPTAQSRTCERDSRGFPMHTGGFYEDVSFKKSIGTWFDCLEVIYGHTNGITHLMFRGCEWLDITALRAIVLAMPNLKAISVHQCFLLHFGYTENFIDIINEVNAARGPGEARLSGDFTPMYYRAARDPKYRTGEYGVIPNDEGCIDTRRAVVARLCRISKLCDDNGIDFFTPGKAFRAYLDRLPFRFGTLPTILMAIATLWDLDHGKHYQQVVDAEWPPIVQEVGELGGAGAVVSSRVARAMHATTWRDLLIALNGASMTKQALDQQLLRDDGSGEVALLRCAFCGARLPACFYREDCAARAPDQRICHGCQLAAYLDQQPNSYYPARARIARLVFSAGRGRAPLSLPQLVRLEHKVLAAHRRARALARGDGDGEGFGAENVARADRYGDRPTKRQRARRLAGRFDEAYPDRVAQGVRETEARIAVMREELHHGAGEARGAKRSLRERICDAELAVSVLRAAGGSGQIVVPGMLQEAGPAAASWEAEVDWYRACWALESGEFVNTGPYGMYNADSSMAAMYGRGPNNYDMMVEEGEVGDGGGGDAADDDDAGNTGGLKMLPGLTTDSDWAGTISARPERS